MFSPARAIAFAQSSAATAALLLVLGATPAAAQSAPERVWVEIGGYLPSVNSEIQVSNPQTGVAGTLVDLEEDLKLSKRKTLPAISVGIPLSGSVALVADMYKLNRQNSAIIDEEISYDGAIYPVSAKVESKLDSTIYRLAAAVTVLRRNRTELGFSAGAHITDFRTSMSGEVVQPDNSIQIVRRQRKLLAPLPTIGAFASHKITPRLTASGKIDALSLKVGKYKGRLFNSQIAAYYRIGKSLNVGVMYRYVDYRLKVKKSDWVGDIRYAFKGPALTLRWSI